MGTLHGRVRVWDGNTPWTVRAGRRGDPPWRIQGSEWEPYIVGCGQQRRTPDGGGRARNRGDPPWREQSRVFGNLDLGDRALRRGMLHGRVRVGSKETLRAGGRAGNRGEPPSWVQDIGGEGTLNK